MRFQLYLLLILSMFAFSVCGGSEEAANNSNDSASIPANSTPNTAPSKPRLLDKDISTPTTVPTVEAVTLKPVVDAFCKARRSKDEAALRKTFSAATLKNLLEAAQSEGKKSITEYLESEPVGDKCTIVNERIVGDTGEATFSTETYPNGITWKFVKEGGSWKLTDQSSDFEKVKKAAQ